MKTVKRYILRYVGPPDMRYGGVSDIGDDPGSFTSVPVTRVRRHLLQYDAQGLPAAVIILPFNSVKGGAHVARRLKPRVVFNRLGRTSLLLRRSVNASVKDWMTVESTVDRLRTQQTDAPFDGPRASHEKSSATLSPVYKKLVALISEATTLPKLARIFSWGRQAYRMGQLDRNEYGAVLDAVRYLRKTLRRPWLMVSNAPAKKKPGKKRKTAGKKRPAKKKRRSEWSPSETAERQRVVRFYLDNGMSPAFLRAAMAEFERRLRARRRP